MKTEIISYLIYIISIPCYSQHTWSINNRDSTLNVEMIDSIIFNPATPNDTIVIEGKHFKICSKPKLYVKKGTEDIIAYCDSIIKINFPPIVITFKSLDKANKLTLNFSSDAIGTKPATATGSKAIINIFYDALDLFSKDKKKTKDVFLKYKWSSTNNYLKEINIDRSAPQAASDIKNGISFNLSNIGGLDVTNLADGLAKFIVSRVKKELAISFFNDFSKKIRDTSLKDIQVLFKNTYSQLDLIADRIYDYQPYLASLKQSMEYDSQELPSSFQSLLENEDSQLSGFLGGQKNLRYLSHTALKLGLEIKASKHVGRAIEEMEFNKIFSNTDSNLVSGLQSIQLLSEAFRDTATSDTAAYWISDKQFEQLLQNEKLLQYFIGLVAVKAENDSIKFSSVKLYDILNNNFEHIKEFWSVIQKMKYAINQVQTAILEAKTKINQDEKDITSLRYFTGASAIIEAGAHWIGLLVPYQKPNLEAITKVTRDANQMVCSIAGKKYTSALVHFTGLLNYILKDKHDTRLTSILNIVAKQGLFLAQVSEAKTSDEVAAVVESFAAPVGSWRDKRQDSWNIALDSYVGPTTYFNSGFALSTPVGLSVSKAFNKDFSLTAMVSLFDIGPLTAYRFVESEKEVVKIYLKEIWAPGIITSIGFVKNWPVFLNLAWQKSAELEKACPDMNQINVHNVNKFGVSLNVNVPLLSLYRKSHEGDFFKK